VGASKGNYDFELTIGKSYPDHLSLKSLNDPLKIFTTSVVSAQSYTQNQWLCLSSLSLKHAYARCISLPPSQKDATQDVFLVKQF
jgi:hypothetical protein